MSGTTVTYAVLLMSLACIVTIGSGQSCDDVTCCPGKVCREDSTAKGLKNSTKCVHPTSCDQLDCPAGFACSRRGRGGVECRPTCSNVACAESYACREKHRRTECRREPSVNCTGVQCPQGTVCHLLREGKKEKKKEYAVCLGESCLTANCFGGTQCFDGTRITSAKNRDTIIVHTEDGNATVSLKTLHTKATKESTNTPRRPAANVEDIAICLPACEGANVCPEGLVCHNDNHKITCQPPRSCEELRCGPNQECQELECDPHKPKRRPHPKTKPDTAANQNQTVSEQSPKSKPKSHHRHVILQCVATTIPTTETTPPPTTEATNATPETTREMTEATTATTEATTATTETPMPTTEATTNTTEFVEGGDEPM